VLAVLREEDDAADEVVDVTEAPRLLPISEDREGLARNRLPHEVRHRAPVVRAHARAVRVEDPDDRRVDAVLLEVRHRQRLGIALRLVVHGARPDRVHVPPVRLRLRVNLRVAVHLARRGREEAAPFALARPSM
jgi:hypothetical protein